MLLLAGCSSGDYSGDTARPPPPAVTSTTTAAEVTLRGVVAQTLASARVVVLAEPVSGFGTIAFTADTEVVRADGAKAAINDIAPRAAIEVTGRPGGSASLLARRVVLL